MSAAGGVVSKLVGKQNDQQGQGERPAEQETAGLSEEPGPGPEIALIDDGGAAVEKVLHEAGTDSGGCNNADDQKQCGETVFTPTSVESYLHKNCGGGALACEQSGWKSRGEAGVPSQLAQSAMLDTKCGD